MSAESVAPVTLLDFLLARIAEDEGAAIYAQTRDDLQPEDWGGWWFGHHQHYSRYDPARVLAECEMKREIVRLQPPSSRTIRILATVYAHHPDYREAWRP